LRKGQKCRGNSLSDLESKERRTEFVIDAEDALIAALKVKAERPEATIMYVRRLNRLGDTRHPPHNLTGGRYHG
jgi:hypothetical protein